jgi:WD40 repeat protein/serine/threonine protein kinase
MSDDSHYQSLVDQASEEARAKQPSEDATLTFARSSAEDDGTLPAGRSETSAVANVVAATSLTEDAQLKNGESRFFGDYELLEEIARGGMGVVYKARQRKLNRLVALKMILAGDFAGEDEVRRFHAEAEAAANLDHPGIVPIFEVGEQQGRHFYSMAFIEGQSLATRVKEGPLAAREAATLVQQVASAIHFAHDQGVIHRDLKPHNILIGRDGQPRVTDFGLAKQSQRDSDLTGTGQILGTPSYMPPEQASAQTDKIGVRSDVYSLGAILYCLLVGRPPFQASNPLDTLRQVLEREPVPPRQLDPQIPRDLDTICLKCLEKEPGRRYHTAKDLAEELQRFLKNEPIQARPITRLEGAWRWSRREPKTALLLGAVFLSLLVGTIVSSVFAVRAQRHSNAAVKAHGELQIALTAETKANQKLGEALDESQHQLSVNYIERGIAHLEAGQRMPGLLCLLKAYESSDSSDPVRTGARNLLTGWGANLGQPFWYDGVRAIAFSPDGQTIVVASGAARLCDARTGLPRGEPMRHGNPVIAAVFSPDGKTVLTGGSNVDNTARLWDARTGRPRGKPMHHAHNVYAVAFSPDGQTVLTGSHDKTARLWDAQTCEPRGEPMLHEDYVSHVAFSPGGQMVLTVSGKSARLWDAQTGEARGEPMLHALNVSDVAFSPDGQTILTAGNDGTRWWDAESGRPLNEPSRSAVSARTVIFSPDGQTVLTTGSDAACLLDASTGKLRGQPMKHGAWVRAAAFSPDGRTILTGCHDKTAQLWDAKTCEPRGKTMLHEEPVLDVLFSPDGRIFVTICQDGTARIWDAALPEHQPAPMRHEAEVLAVAFSPDGKTIVSGSADKTARLWDAKSGVPRGRPMQHVGRVNAVAFGPDGQTVLTGTGDIEESAARLWDAATALPRGGPMSHLGPVLSVAFSPDGKTAVTAMNGGPAVRLWDVSTRKLRGNPIGHGGTVCAAAFSPDGRTILTGSVDGTARLWDANTQLPRGEPMRHEGSVFAVAFSPDGRSIVTGSRDGTARLWNAETGRLRNEPSRHTSAVHEVAFSPDGQTVLTGCGGTTRLWDANTGKPRGAPMLSANTVNAVAFRPDGESFVIASGETLELGKTQPIIADEPERIRLWIEVLTSRCWDENNVVQRLSSDECAARRRQLAELGGPPVP